MTRRTVDVAGTSLSVRVNGAPDGVPFVFWHSLGHAGNGSFLDVAVRARRAGLQPRSRSTRPGSAVGRAEPTPTRSTACGTPSSPISERGAGTLVADWLREQRLAGVVLTPGTIA